jgi:ubiquinone/menaquinone biosynthesis C-methylase UbiE
MGKKPSAKKDEERFDVLKDKIRKRLLKYTRRAFWMLPEIDKPRILDVGCGSGIPTLELARLGKGEVTGIDIDQPALDKFSRQIKEAGLTNRIKVINCSMFDMDFADESFDIIWSEGSIYAIGFEKGLREWKRLLTPGGFIVVHDEQENISEKLGLVSDCGYELIGHFLLSQDTWRREYFAPLEKLVNEFQIKLASDQKTGQGLHQAREELEMFRKNPERNSSVYFIMKRQP